MCIIEWSSYRVVQLYKRSTARRQPFTDAFSLSINALANEIKEANRGIPVNDDNICLLLYAGDIVLLAEKIMRRNMC